MTWKKVRLKDVLRQYRIEHIVQDDKIYKQVTISKHDGVCFRGTKIGKEIGRKRQFIIDLKNHPNTLMFVRQGVYDGSIGLAPKEVDECIATENMPMFDVINIDKEFLSLVLRSNQFKDDLSKIETTGTAQKSLHERQVLELEIPYPESSIQKEIVNKFSSVSKKANFLVLELTHQLDLVKQLRQAFLREAMQGKLAPQDPNDEPASELLKKIKVEKEQLIKEKKIKKENELPPIKPEEIPFEIPENWVWCRLGDIILSAKDGPHFSPTYASRGVPFISTRNISPGGIDFSSCKYITEQYHEEISRKCKPVKGDLLYTKGGTTGIATVNTYDTEFNVWVHVAVLKMGSFMNPFFLRDSLNSPHCYTQSQKLTRGIGNQDLGLTRMVNITLPLPPLSEQHRIVTKLEQLMRYCDDLEQSIKQSQIQNEQLLQQVLREALMPSKEYKMKVELSLAAED